MHNYTRESKIDYNVLPSSSEETEESPYAGDDFKDESVILSEPEYIPTSIEPGVSDPILINPSENSAPVDNPPFPVVDEDVKYNIPSDKAGETSFFCLDYILWFALFIILFAVAFSYLRDSKSSFGGNDLAPAYHIKSAFKIAN